MSKPAKDLTPKERIEIKEKANSLSIGIKEANREINKLPNWITNISIGLLGFVVALLIQMKSSEYEFSILFSLSLLVVFSISIVIGFLLRVKDEVNRTFSGYIFKIESTILYSNYLSTIIDEVENRNLDEDLKELRKEELLKPMSFKKWSRFVTVQMFFFWLGLIFLAQFLLRYIYGS